MNLAIALSALSGTTASFSISRAGTAHTCRIVPILVASLLIGGVSAESAASSTSSSSSSTFDAESNTKRLLRGDSQSLENANDDSTYNHDSIMEVDGPDKIIGGGVLPEGERPYLVAIGREDSLREDSLWLAGTLISSRAVLTGARFFFDGNGNFYPSDWADFNRYDLRDAPNAPGSTIDRRILSSTEGVIQNTDGYVVRHPDYDPGTIDNDFALIILKEPVIGIDPVALNRDDSIPANIGDDLETFGWGDIDPDDDFFEYPNVPNTVTVDYLPNEECNKSPYDTAGDITPNMLCAYTNKKGPCSYDEGGPIMDGTVQVGVVSWFSGGNPFCVGENDSPGVYSRVSTQIDWIEQTVCEKTGELCPMPSSQPSEIPSSSGNPSSRPSGNPSSRPSEIPSSWPSGNPSSRPSEIPSSWPSGNPSSRPSGNPSSWPSGKPSSQPSETPSSRPSEAPSSRPSEIPSSWPSGNPSSRPSGNPSSWPSETPSSRPSGKPSSQPSETPSSRPSEFSKSGKGNSNSKGSKGKVKRTDLFMLENPWHALSYSMDYEASILDDDPIIFGSMSYTFVEKKVFGGRKL